jgi:hypothetical protein
MNHQELIETFFSLTGSFDEELAVKYLTNNNWDLSSAFAEFERGPPKDLNNAPDLSDQEIPEEPSLSQYIKGALNWVISPFFSRKPSHSFSSYLETLAPPSSPRLSRFNLATLPIETERAKKNGLIYIHQSEFSDQFVRTVLCNSEIVSIINNSFLFLGVLGESDEGAQAVSRFSDENTAIFVVFRGKHVLGRLEYQPSTDELLEFLIGFLEDPGVVDDRAIRQRQDEEFKEMERVHKMRQDEERQKALKIKLEEEQMQALRFREEKIRAEREKFVGDEPDMASGITQITFRLPSGEKIERRFHEDTLADVLITFLKTKGMEDCELLAGYPPSPLQSGSLKQFGLTPRGLIHVRLNKTD